MLRKIALLTSLLFVPIGAHAFAHSHLEVTTNPLTQTILESNTNLGQTLQVSYNMEKMAIGTNETLTKNHEASPSNSKDEEPSFHTFALPVSIGILIIVALGSYWLIFRKKHL